MDKELVWKAIEYVETCGLVVRGTDCGCPDEYTGVHHVPFTINPSPMQMKTFNSLENLQLIINKLIHNSSNDQAFIEKTLSDLSKIDDFWSHVVNVWRKSKSSFPEPFSLGLHRSDFLLETNSSQQRAIMVEFNTIASSMGGHAVGIMEMHKSIGTAKNLYAPPNNVIDSLVLGMKTAVDKFCDAVGKERDDVCVIVLREEGNSRNFSDQKRVELLLQKALNYQVDIHRTGFSTFFSSSLSNNGELFYKGKEVALFYLRAGYDPKCYVTDNSEKMNEDSWASRLLIEKSRATKSPPIGYHLLTNKRFQAEFSKKDVLMRYLTEEEADHFLETSCKIVSLEMMDTEIVQDALSNPASYCLKILREGGAEGNIFGDDIIPKLEEMKSDPTVRQLYVLMEKIEPDIVENTLVRCGVWKTIPTISEVGIFGVYLHDNKSNQVVIDSNNGHLVRTKPSTSNVGGVNVGGACIGSLYLTK